MAAVAASLFPDLDGHWLAVTDADSRLYSLYRRHYTYEKTRNYPGKVRLRQNARVCKMQSFGDYMALLTAGCSAGWIWSRPPDGISQSGQRGVNCVLFRNESEIRSSDLIREACDLAWRRWPGERLFTYVWDAKVQTSGQKGRAKAGWCYRKAGWKPCGRNADGRLTILEILP